MTDSKPVRCQKCGKPVGYVTVLAKGLTLFQQPLQNIKIVCHLHGMLSESKQVIKHGPNNEGSANVNMAELAEGLEKISKETAKRLLLQKEQR